MDKVVHFEIPYDDAKAAGRRHGILFEGERY